MTSIKVTVMSRCHSCGAGTFPGGVSCARCGSLDVAIEELPASGIVESRTLVGDRWICEIRLEGGLLILGRMNEAPAIGGRVRSRGGLEFVCED